MSDLESVFHSLCIRQSQVILFKLSTVKYVIFYSFFLSNISDLWGNESISCFSLSKQKQCCRKRRKVKNLSGQHNRVTVTTAIYKLGGFTDMSIKN